MKKVQSLSENKVTATQKQEEMEDEEEEAEQELKTKKQHKEISSQSRLDSVGDIEGGDDSEA